MIKIFKNRIKSFPSWNKKKKMLLLLLLLYYLFCYCVAIKMTAQRNNRKEK